MKTGFFYSTQLLLSNIKLKDDDDVKHVIVTYMQKCEEGKFYLTKLQYKPLDWTFSFSTGKKCIRLIFNINYSSFMSSSS